MMNSPFVVEQARALASQPGIQEQVNAEAKVASLYRTVFQRDPAPEELSLAANFLATAETVPPLDTPVWQYGYGAIDPATSLPSSFTPLPKFANNQYSGIAETLPDPELGWTSITPDGGHPGIKYATILRWVSPGAGTVSASGRIRHGSDKGDGVIGYINSSTQGQLWTGTAFNGRAPFRVTDIPVQAGDTLDFVVAAGPTEGFDGYGLSPKVVWIPTGGGETNKKEWQARRTFLAPAPQPLDPVGRFAQVLMLTNEFLFVD